MLALPSIQIHNTILFSFVGIILCALWSSLETRSDRRPEELCSVSKCGLDNSLRRGKKIIYSFSPESYSLSYSPSNTQARRLQLMLLKFHIRFLTPADNFSMTYKSELIKHTDLKKTLSLTDPDACIKVRAYIQGHDATLSFITISTAA